MRSILRCVVGALVVGSILTIGSSLGAAAPARATDSPVLLASDKDVTVSTDDGTTVSIQAVSTAPGTVVLTADDAAGSADCDIKVTSPATLAQDKIRKVKLTLEGCDVKKAGIRQGQVRR